MRPRARRYLAIIIVNLAIIALIELTCAIFIRKHFKKANDLFQRSAEVEQPFAVSTGYQMRANAVIADSAGKTRIRTDDRGNAIVPDALPNPRFTLAVLGGSSMFGVGVRDNAANVPSQVQTVLRRDYGLDVNVTNLAARGYVSLQELLSLNERLAERHFDMVVSVSGHNDIMRYLRGDLNSAYVKSPDCDAAILVRKVEAGKLVISNIGPALRRISHTANLMALAMESIAEKKNREMKDAMNDREIAKRDAVKKDATVGGAAKKNPSVSRPTFFSSHIAHYAMMKAVCDTHHTDFKLFFQPNVFTKASLSQQERDYTLNKDCSGQQAKLDALCTAHRDYRATFGALPMSFPYTDLAGVFDKADTIYLDSCHYNEEGAACLARAIAADLAPIIRARLEAQKPQ
jgi:lysophospholipase L1-like esterase